MSKKKLLDKNYRNGEVWKKEIFKNKRLYIAKLTLMPHSEILEHEHTDDNEIYIIIQSGKITGIEVCRIGNSHSLVNGTDFKMKVYAIKCK